MSNRTKQPCKVCGWMTEARDAVCSIACKRNQTRRIYAGGTTDDPGTFEFRKLDRSGKPTGYCGRQHKNLNLDAQERNIG